MFIFGQIHPW